MSAGVRCLTSDIPENKAVLGGFGPTFSTADQQSLYEKLREALDAPRAIPGGRSRCAASGSVTAVSLQRKKRGASIKRLG